MRRKVYRSLDRPAAFFGIRGRFMWVMALGGAIALVVGLVAGRAVATVAGFGAGLVGAVAAYLLTLSLQSRIDERTSGSASYGRVTLPCTGSAPST